MYTRILIPTDFSEHSAPAVEHGVSLARELGAEVVLLHVFDRPSLLRVPAGDGALRAYLDQAFEEADRRLQQLVEVCDLVACRGVSAQGSPWREILRVARDEACDLICIGSHGRGALAQLVVGGVTRKVLHHADRPVLVVRPSAGVNDPFADDEDEG